MRTGAAAHQLINEGILKPSDKDLSICRGRSSSNEILMPDQHESVTMSQMAEIRVMQFRMDKAEQYLALPDQVEGAGGEFLRLRRKLGRWLGNCGGLAAASGTWVHRSWSYWIV
jgi:hypothetical protein